MKRMKGIGLLLLSNILIFITLSITFTILSEMILPAFGIDIRGMIVHQDLLWAFVLGFGGAFISLAFSKQMARAMLDCRQITQPTHPAELLVYETVRKIAWPAGHYHAGSVDLRFPGPQRLCHRALEEQLDGGRVNRLVEQPG